jgi:glucose-6-phosphate 1-epimerase
MNFEYAIQNQLSFIEAQGGFATIKIDNKHASALISLYGAQVLSYKPKSKRNEETTDILFVSDKSYYQPGKAIKGGIPVCWPWFGNDPENSGRPAHGFARISMWSIADTATLENGETQLILCLTDSEETQRLWPYAFKLTITITVGKTLRLELQTHNTGKQTLTITQALHTYFSVADINQARVIGLDEARYIDKTSDSESLVQQHGDVIIDQEVDRIYIGVPVEMALVDDKNKRQIQITASGSKTTVIWNPWAEISASMADLQDADYMHFLCVETANATTDSISIAVDESFKISAEYSVGWLS